MAFYNLLNNIDIRKCENAIITGKHLHKLQSNIVGWLRRRRIMVFNTISVISWRSVLLVEETVVSRENHWSAASYWQTLSHKCCIEYPSPCAGFKPTKLVVKGNDCIKVVVTPTAVRSQPRRPPWPIDFFLCLTPLSAIFQLYHGDPLADWS